MYKISADDKQLYDDGTLSLKGLVKAYKAQDPRLAEYACKLTLLDPYPVKRVQYSRTTIAVMGHSSHGMSTVYQALQTVFTSRGGHLVESKNEFTYTDSENQQFIGIDVGTVSKSKKALERAQVLCVVISAEHGVKAQTRECIKMAAKHGVSTAVVCVSKVDAVAESERDAVVATILDKVEEELNQHGIDFDGAKSVSGSALLALKKDNSSIGLPAMEQLVKSLETSTAPIQISNTVSLKKYAEFRRSYHQDAIKWQVLNEVQPSYEYKGGSGHQLRRKKKAELMSQRFTQLQQEYPDHIPDRVKLGEFMLMLYDDRSLYAEEQLLEMVRHIPLKWGPWQAFKFILKRGLLDQRWMLFATAYNRWSTVFNVIRTYRNYRSKLDERYMPIDVFKVNWSSPTYIKYSDRSKYRALNLLRGDAAEITTESKIFLKKLFDRIYMGQYARLSDDIRETVTTEVLMQVRTFKTGYYYKDIWAQWAKRLAWASTDSSKRLMRLWQEAECQDVRDWAFKVLQKKHPDSLKALPLDWVIQNGLNPKCPVNIRQFITTWIVQPITEIQKEDFIAVGLHKVVLTFLDPSFGSLKKAQVKYACDFIRQFMDELVDLINLDKVLWLLRHRDTMVHELGVFLLFPDGEKSSPYQEQLNLDFWTDLISDGRMHTYAVKAIKDRFKQQITLEWLKARLYSKHQKELNLAKTFIRDGFHVRDVDFYPVYYANLFTQPGRYSLYDWSWSALSKQDVEGNSLISENFGPVDYRKMLLSNQDQNVRYAIDAYRNQKVSQEDFPIAFLKCLFSNYEWSQSKSKMSEFLQEELDSSTIWKKDIKVSFSSSLSRILKSFAYDTMISRTDFTMETLGLQWVLDRRQQNGSEYSSIRKMFQDKFPNYALRLLSGVSADTLEDSPENNRAGVQQVLDIIDEDLMYNGSSAKFWKPFILSRIVRVVEFHGQPFEYSSSCTIDSSVFSFEWFDKQIADDGTRSQYHRAFALEMAQMFLTDWIASAAEPFGFKALEPYLFSRFSEVSKYFFEVVDNPQTKYARIDLNDAAFKSEELFEYCYSSSSKVRSTGLKFIQQYPEKFAQPDKLVELTTSPDQNVRALVIEILYNIAHIPLVTPNWRPYEDSVIPGNSKLSERSSQKMQISYSSPPKSGTTSGRRKYLGKGTPNNLEPQLTDHARLVLFAVQQLFQLPAKPPKRADAGNAKVPMWKMKRLLIESFRDLALQDREFAELMVPVFQELTQYKGKRVQEMSWSALAHLEAKYQANPLSSLTVFGD